jgi:hypothetical protein
VIRARSRRAALAAGALASTLAASPAGAEPSKEDVARADALFRDAQVLVQKGNYVEGCARYAESQKLDPANGTLLNLALCHEKEGRYATSYRELQALLTGIARSKNPDDRDRARTASERIRLLEKKVPRVAFDVSLLPKDATVTLDAERVKDPRSVILIDPGRHLVEATAPSKKPRKTTIEVKEGGAQTFTLEALEDDAPAPLPPPPPAPATERPEPPRRETTIYWTPQRVLGAAVAGGGVVALGVGAAFGLDTFSKKTERDARCSDVVCDEEGLRLHEDARASAAVATVGFGVGAVLVVVGLYLFATAPSRVVAVGARPVERRVVGLRPGGLAVDF